MGQYEHMNERLAHCFKWISENQPHIDRLKQESIEKQRLAQNRSSRKRYHNDPGFVLQSIRQSMLSRYMRSWGKDRSTPYGCSLHELREHISGQFNDGMTWENYGSLWEVDHVIPCSHFDLPREIFQCFHYTNLRPRIVALNRLDGRKAGKWRYLESRDKFYGYR